MASIAVKPSYELSETEIRNQMKDYLNARNIFFWCDNQTFDARGKTQRRIKGVPDMFISYRKRMIANEIKKPGLDPSRFQYEWMMRFIKEGHIAVCTHSVDELARALSEVR